jgi:molybdopterin molybdotransferase
MISVQEALELIEANVTFPSPLAIPLRDSLGLMLAEDVLAPIDMPPFSQSAMDGYAVNFSPEQKHYKVIGEIQAGSGELFDLEKGEAVRIFTGAAVPESANVVVKQEIVAVDGSSMSFADVKIGANIRPKGEQTKKGEVALEKGCEIKPATIGYLATLGLTHVFVFPRPKISILTTGNELVKAGTSLKHGEIYESNSIMLETAFNHYGFNDISLLKVADIYEETVSAIKLALEKSDFIVLSGGISVGDYDFVAKALKEIGVKEVFHKVNQKPGKPLFFGTYDRKMIFALPGNPAAALTAFYLYILPSLNALTGGSFEGCKPTQLPISQQLKKKGNRTEILKAFATETEVEILNAQSSAMLSSFSDANALVIIPAESEGTEKGSMVLTLLL